MPAVQPASFVSLKVRKAGLDHCTIIQEIFPRAATAQANHSLEAVLAVACIKSGKRKKPNHLNIPYTYQINVCLLCCIIQNLYMGNLVCTHWHRILFTLVNEEGMAVRLQTYTA